MYKQLKQNSPSHFVDYFSRPYHFDINNVKVEFRKKAGVKVKDTDALKMQIQDDIDQFLELDSLLNEQRVVTDGLKPYNNSISTIYDAMTFAMHVRNEWNLGTDSIANVYYLLESKGFEILSTDGPDGFDGVSGLINGTHHIIVINRRLDQIIERRRFTIMHEVGHLLMKNYLSADVDSKMVEKLCHAFTGEMLLPLIKVKQTLGNKSGICDNDLISLQREYGMSIDAIVHKLHDTGIINDSNYKKFNILKNKIKGRKEYIETSRYNEGKIEILKEMAFHALMQEILSFDRATEIIGIPEEELYSIINNKLRLNQCL